MDDLYKRTANLRSVHEGSNVALAYDRPLLLSTGVGIELFDDEGKRYLDTVNNVAIAGHCHPEIVRSQVQQLQKLNTNSRYLCSVHSQYVSAITKTFPKPLKVCYLVNSGSEANDLALQIATAARPGAQHIAVMEGGYHGHVSSMMRLSPYKFWGPSGSGRPDGVHILPLPDMYREKYISGAAAAQAAIRQAEKEGGRIAAFICESELSCAGQIMLPKGFLFEVYQKMREHGAICIADEVQCGFGRLGDVFWGWEAHVRTDFASHGVVPDIVVFGKGAGNGYPLAGLVASNIIIERFAEGPPYFNTYGGGNVACASGLAVLDVIASEGLQANSRDVGKYLRHHLSKLRDEFPDVIGDVRGRGLFVGVEIVDNADSKAVSPGKAQWIKENMKFQQVLMSADGVFGNVLKIKPPLVFSFENADELVAKLRQACTAVAEQASEVESLNSVAMSRYLPGQREAYNYIKELVGPGTTD